MKLFSRLCLFLPLLTAGLSLGRMAAAETAPAAQLPHPLEWDALEKTRAVQRGESAADFEFTATNRSDKPVEILQLRPSCGCTTADMPRTPWILAPGEKGSFRATVNFPGKEGRFTKGVYVATVAGTQVLTMHVDIPEPDATERQRNQQLAAANRQMVFRGTCAQCHVEPIGAKTGQDLFHAACAICHFASQRATMVPDLLTANTPRDADYWRKWISEGREGSLMPGFAQKHGGPLTDEQIESLVKFALERLPTQPRKN